MLLLTAHRIKNQSPPSRQPLLLGGPSGSSLYSHLVGASTGDIAHPSVGVVSSLIIDTQESNVHPACCEHGDLELDLDGGAAPCLLPDTGREGHIRVEDGLCAPSETLDAPNNSTLLGLILCSSNSNLDGAPGRVGRDRNLDNYVRREELVAELCDALQV